MQIQTMKYYDTPIRTAKILNTDDAHCWTGDRATEIVIRHWWGRKMEQCSGFYKAEHGLTPT